MAQQSYASSSLAYDGYDPSWIIGTESGYSYPMYYAPSMSMEQGSRNLYGHGHRTYFDHYDTDPRQTVYTTSPYDGYGPYAPHLATHVASPYHHGHGHTVGYGLGHKNMVVLKVPFCCEGCEERWKDNLTDLPGFKGVNVDRRAGNLLIVTVFGNIDPREVSEAVQSVQARAELWR